MTRSSIYQHLPHALLLAAAAVGLSLTSGAPTDIHTPQLSIQADTVELPDLPYNRSYMDARGDTRSLADIIRQARIRINALQRSQADDAEQTADHPTPLASLMTEPQHRRMVRRQDIVALPTAEHRSNTLVAEYVGGTAPLTWQPPESIAEREYTVLEFGALGGENPEATGSTLSPVVSTSSQPTSPTGVFTADAETRTPGLPAALSSAEISVSPQPSALADTPAAHIIPMQSASRQAPTPLASQSVPVTESDSARLAVQTPAPQKAQVQTRTQMIDTPSQTAFNSNHQPVDRTPTTDSMSPATGPDRSWTEKPVAKTNPLTHKNTPTVTPKFLVTADKHLDNHDDRPTPSSASSKDKPGNPLLVYIDEYNKIGSDRVNAIDNALSRINQAVKKASLDVELKITTDMRSDYNIRFAENDGKGMGNKLGLAEFAVTEDDHGNEFFLGENSSTRGGKAQISINNAFNWFAGDDANDIDEDEYDYQTAVAHEFLHLLGLDDDYDNLDSVTHALLSPGEVRREVHDREVNTLSDIFAYANPWQSAYTPASWSSNFLNNKSTTRYKAKALTAFVVPEPASLGLIVLGLLGAMQRCRR